MLWPITYAVLVLVTGQFIVAGQPRNIKFGYQGITKLGLVGTKVTVDCPREGPFYLWRIFQSNFESRVLLDQDSRSIVIDSATLDITGIYECKVTSGFGNAVTNITLKIIDPNSEISKEMCTFRKADNSIDFLAGLCFLNEGNYRRRSKYKMGSSTELDCEAVGINIRYTWKFIDQNGVQAIISKSNNITRLTIVNISPENEGSYKCEVTDEKGLKIYRMFPITITDITSDSGIEVIGGKFVSYSLKPGDNASLMCEIKNKYQRIHSTKWGKRIGDPMSELKSTGNVVFWDQHNYRVLPIAGISETKKNQNELVSTLSLTNVNETNAGLYICLAMNTFGGTVYKLFNLTISNDVHPENRSQFFFIFILSPAILIFVCICAIIYCCVKSSSTKSSNTMPLKQYNSSTQSNGNKTATSNYYYPVTNTRTSTNCPPLPQPAESQLSQVSPNTLTSYSSYGNYHFLPSNQQSCYSSNGV